MFVWFKNILSGLDVVVENFNGIFSCVLQWCVDDDCETTMMNMFLLKLH